MRTRTRPMLAAVAAVQLLAACKGRQAPSYQTQPVTRGPVAEVVSATGSVEAIVTVNVGSQVSGTISKLGADFNSLVKKKQMLAQIDPRPFQAALAKSEAGIASAEANVEKARVALLDAERNEKRIVDLFDRKLVALADVHTAQANREGAAAVLLGARATVRQARADRAQAALNLEFTRIESPIDGIVVSRSVDVGQTVAAAFQAATLFVIANDLTKMRVLANIDEADVGKVKDGAEVHFSVDSYPGEDFNGAIHQVRQAPNTINNVVTYAAEIEAPNPERKLRQGMTAAVQVITNRRASALRVPNAALRWKPDDAAPPGPGSARPERKREGADGGTPQAQASTPPGQRPNEVLDRQRGIGNLDPGRSGSGAKKQRTSKVYKLVAGQPVAVTVRTGVSDGHQTEVLDGLAEGDEVIVGGGGPGGQRAGGPRRGLF